MESYTGPILRHIWLISFVVVAMTAAAYAVADAQPAEYQATSELLVNQGPAVALPNVGSTRATDSLSLERQVSTQLQLGRIPAIATQALVNARIRTMTAAQLLRHVSLASKPDADLLTVTVTASSPELARRLSSAYAKAVSTYEQSLLSNALNGQRSLVQAAISHDVQTNPTLANALRDHLRIPPESLYAQLVSGRNALQAAAAEVPATSVVVNSASQATQIAPRPKRNAALAFALALILGTGLAFLIDRFGKRAHTTTEIGEQLGLPLLARVPAPRRRPRRAPDEGAASALTMLTDPGSPHAEAIKMLQANLEMARLHQSSSVIMVASAVSGEGKSTTIVNLAVSLAQGGRDVVLVDADLRRPALAYLLGLSPMPGFAERAAGEPVPLAEVQLDSVAALPVPRGRLRLLPAGRPTDEPDRLLSSPAMADVFAQLRSEADFVLVDTPPMTEVYDSMIVLRHVDAVIAVARVAHVKLPALAELARLLSTTSVLSLGYVATGIKREDINRYDMNPSAEAARGSTAPAAVET